MGTKYTFYQKPITDITSLLQQNQSFTVMGVSDFGRSAFIKKLSESAIADHIVNIDIYDLSEYSRINLLKLIYKQLAGLEIITDSESEIIEASQKELQKLVQKHSRIVIIINRVDLVQFKIDKTFFDQLRSLISVDNKKISYIFGTCKRINEIAEGQLSGSDVLFFSNIYYLPLYSKNDLLVLAKDYGVHLPEKDILNRALDLSGGHFQLFQLLLKKNFAHNDPIKDEFILLALKSIYNHLTYSQKVTLQKVVSQKNVSIDDEFLLATGMIKKTESHYSLFSPLFEQYLQLFTQHKIPAKEKRLLKLLKDKKNNVVSRDDIFKYVWGNDLDNATDWALDALVYRLRKNAVFKNSGFSIESHKKQGYSLVQS